MLSHRETTHRPVFSRCPSIYSFRFVCVWLPPHSALRSLTSAWTRWATACLSRCPPCSPAAPCWRGCPCRPAASLRASCSSIGCSSPSLCQVTSKTCPTEKPQRPSLWVWLIGLIRQYRFCCGVSCMFTGKTKVTERNLTLTHASVKSIYFSSQNTADLTWRIKSFLCDLNL